MEFDDPLLPILETYRVTKDCLKVTQKTIAIENEYLLMDTHFIGTSKEDVSNKIIKSRSEAEDSVVVLLWAVFERFIISYVQEKGMLILQNKKQPSSFSKKFYGTLRDAVERWKIDGILDMFKNGWIDPQLIGHAKNIKKYRDWIVHRNPAKASTPKATPETAHEILSKLIWEIQTLSS